MRQKLVLTQQQKQLQTMTLEQYPSGLLTHNIFTDLTNPALFNKIKIWRFKLAEILGRQIYGTIQQYTPSYEGTESGMRVIEQRMIDQRFEHSQLLRTSVMFALMLVSGLFDEKNSYDEDDPTLQLLLALPDSIMAQQYIQNHIVDKKNEKLRNSNEDILKHLREYWDYTIKNLIHNMQIENKKKEAIEKIYRHMNYDLVQRGQVFDGLLLRQEYYERSLKSLLYDKLDTDISTLHKNESSRLLTIAINPSRYEDDLWQRLSICVEIPGISPYVVKDTLQQLMRMYPERKFVKDFFSDGLIFDLRYRYIDVEYWKGIIRIINTFAPIEDTKLIEALEKLFEHYGYGAQARNDLSDYLENSEFVRNNVSKDENDIHADHRNKMITEIIYSLHKLISEGEDCIIWSEIQSIVKHLGCDEHVFTFPIELKSKSIEDLFKLSPSVLKEYFMKTGLFLWMVQRNISTRTTGVTDVQAYIEQLKTEKELDEEESGIERKLMGMQLIAILTEPAKTPENSIFKQLEQIIKIGRKDIYKLLLEYSRSSSPHKIPEATGFGDLVQVSPFIRYTEVILENIHKPVPEQLKILLPKMKEMADAAEDSENNDYGWIFRDYIVFFSSHTWIDDLNDDNFRLFFESKLSRVRNEFSRGEFDQEKSKTLRDLYAYMIVLATQGKNSYILPANVSSELHKVITDFRGGISLNCVSSFFEEELFRTGLSEKFILNICKKLLDDLYRHIDELSLELQEYIIYCRMIVTSDKFTPTESNSLSKAVYIRAPVFDIMRILESKIFHGGQKQIFGESELEDEYEPTLEDQCAYIYRILSQLPKKIDSDDVYELLQEIAKAKDNELTTKAEKRLLELLEKYFNTDSYTKKELMRDFIGWVTYYPTLMMVISTMAVNHPKYVEYLTSLIYTRKKEEKDPKQIIFLLEYMSSYLEKSDIMKGELYTRHINALSLLILLYSNEEYVEDPLQVFLNRAYPIENEDGQQIYVQKALVDNYDKLIDWWNPGYPGAVEEMLKSVIEIIQPIGAAEILDIGCGPGNILKKVRQALEDNESAYTITAVDKSAPMVEICKERFEGDENVIIKCKDILTMQQVNKYDLITSNLMLHNLSIYNGLKQKAIKKMYDMLKMGGTLLLTDMYYNQKRVEGRKVCIDSFASHKEEIEAMAENHGTTYQAILDYIVEKVLGFDINGGGLVSRKEFELLLKEVGFVDIKILHKTNTDILVISAKKPG